MEIIRQNSLNVLQLGWKPSVVTKIHILVVSSRGQKPVINTDCTYAVCRCHPHSDRVVDIQSTYIIKLIPQKVSHGKCRGRSTASKKQQVGPTSSIPSWILVPRGRSLGSRVRSGVADRQVTRQLARDKVYCQVDRVLRFQPMSAFDCGCVFCHIHSYSSSVA